MLDKTLTQDLSKIVEPRFLNKFAKDQDLNDLDKINYVLEVLQGGVGVIVYDQGRFQVAKRCSKRIVSISERVALLEGMARSASRDFMKDYCDN